MFKCIKAWDRKLNTSALGDGECDRSCAVCREAGGKWQSKFLMPRMFPILCLWNMATGTTKVSGSSIKACPDKKTKTATMLRWNARQNIILHLLLHLSPKQSHLITVQQAQINPLNPSSHSPTVLWVGGGTQLGEAFWGRTVGESMLWRRISHSENKRTWELVSWGVRGPSGKCLLSLVRWLRRRLNVWWWRGTVSLTGSLSRSSFACPSPATDFALYLRQHESGSALQAY